MLEPASQELQRRLRDWQLCQPGDLRRARRHIRRLARDLPAFDSVWIDALVQDGKLTPYQARVLESSAPTALKIGDYVLLHELSSSSSSRTWLARHLPTGTEVALKRVDATDETRDGIYERGTRLVASARLAADPRLKTPSEVWASDNSLLFSSPFVDGLPLSELLVRRGRFPSPIAAGLCRQLASSLMGWHAQGQVHGDIRLSHVRIDAQGRAYLVETGLRPVIEPDITLHSALSLEAYDGIAPEIIGVGAAPTCVSDLYSLGCCIWQLLAGRPPFPVADPLAKLAAHQTRSIEDVREWAPETPAAFAELIHRMTARLPEDRPQSCREIVEALRSVACASPSEIRRFRRRYDSSVPHLRVAPQRSTSMALILGACLVLASVSLLTNGSARQELLLAVRTWNRVDPDQPAREVSAAQDPTAGLIPLPAIPLDGVLVLDQTGPYQAGSLRHVGKLTIQAAQGVIPEIRVRDHSWRLAAEEIALEGIRVRRDSFWAEPAARALMVVQSQRLSLERCELDTGIAVRTKTSSGSPVGLDWKIIAPLMPSAGELILQDCVWLGAGTSLALDAGVRQVDVMNVLRLGPGVWMEVSRTAQSGSLAFRWERLTLRDGTIGLAVKCDAPAKSNRPIAVMATDCVFGLNNRGASLWCWESRDPPELSEATLHWNGEGNLVSGELTMLTWRGTPSEDWQTLDASELLWEGLLAGRFVYRGPPTLTPLDSELAESEAPRRTPDLPGIRAVRLPTRPDEASPPP